MPYPYTLMPDGNTMEPDDVVKPPAETQEESTWTHSPHLDFGNPSPSPTPPSSTQPTSPPPPPPTPPAQQTPPKEQSSGQGSSSESDGQGSKGSSQKDDAPDADRGKDEARAQDELLDYEDGDGDDYIPGLMAGLVPNRLSEYSSLDVILVKQILEARRYTVDRIIATSDSFETACGHLFAFPEDVGGVEVIRRAWRLCQGGGGGSEGSSDDVRNDVHETFTLDDVRQFIEIDLGNAALDEGEAERYELMLEKVFEFDIEWGTTDANKLTQLQNLARSTNYIVKYLAQEVFYGDARKALVAFQQDFSRSEAYGKLIVNLGADEDSGAGGSGYGRVSLQPEYDPQGNLINRQELRKMYLGSAVDIPTIVHEFGHVVDRSRGFTAHLKATVSPYGWSQIATATRIYAEDRGHTSWGLYSFNLDGTVHAKIIEGFLAKQYFVDEIWADLFMTAVLDPSVSGHTFYVRSIGDDMIIRPEPKEGQKEPAAFPHTKYYSDFNSPDPKSDRHFYKCSDEGITCVTLPIMWEDSTWAEAAQGYLPILFEERLSTEGEDQ